MQKTFYDDPRNALEALVGNYDFHENSPYETHLLHLNGDIRKPVLSSPGNAIGFDVGCGEGRMIRRMARILQRCDGADISERAAPRCNFFSADTSRIVVPGRRW